LSSREDEVMMARTWTILGLTLLVACDGNPGTGTVTSRRVTVDVINNGTDSAYGKAEDWNGTDADQKFSLAPAETTTFKINTNYRLKIHIWRTSDNLVLVDEFFDLSDLDDAHDRLSFTVTP
jgi:hypothetical protein